MRRRYFMAKFLVGLLVLTVLVMGAARILPQDGKPMLSDGKPMLSDGRRV